jgi:DNA repair photolyase
MGLYDSTTIGVLVDKTKAVKSTSTSGMLPNEGHNLIKKSITGTNEWAVTTINCSIGCNRNCAYCYARRLSLKQGKIKNIKEWETTNKVYRNLNRENKKYSGTVMFPSMHDINLNNLDLCLEVILNILKAGNKILITSKPELDCISVLCKNLEFFKKRILFRFTIGSSNDEILELWEPGAPSFDERFACLVYAKAKGYKTSISMEPLLDFFNVVKNVKMMYPFTTNSIWIGKMNKINERVINIYTDEIRKIEQGQTDNEIIKIYNKLKYYPKVKWKDSYKKVLNLNSPIESGLDI